MRTIQFDTENVVTVAFLKRTKCYSFSVNSTLIFSVPEYIFNKFSMMLLVRIAYRLFRCNPLKGC